LKENYIKTFTHKEPYFCFLQTHAHYLITELCWQYETHRNYIKLINLNHKISTFVLVCISINYSIITLLNVFISRIIIISSPSNTSNAPNVKELIDFKCHNFHRKKYFLKTIFLHLSSLPIYITNIFIIMHSRFLINWFGLNFIDIKCLLTTLTFLINKTN